MSVFRSAEIRWLFDKNSDQDIASFKKLESLFDDSGLKVLSEKKRTDRYLIFPGMNFVGIKLRESKLEFKPLTQSDVGINLPECVDGKAELWEKWSVSESEAGNILHDFSTTAPQNWMIVEKQRKLRKFSSDSATVKEIDAKERPAEGCGVEITDLKIISPKSEVLDYWTLGLEAFGENKNIIEILNNTLNAFFDKEKMGDRNDFSLLAENSMSYPAFLSKLA